MTEPGTPLPWCEEWMYSAIRHVCRNVDTDDWCPHADEDGISTVCQTPGRYDGTNIARLLTAYPALVARVATLEAALRNANRAASMAAMIMDGIAIEGTTARQMVGEAMRLQHAALNAEAAHA